MKMLVRAHRIKSRKQWIEKINKNSGMPHIRMFRCFLYIPIFSKRNVKNYRTLIEFHLSEYENLNHGK